MVGRREGDIQALASAGLFSKTESGCKYGCCRRSVGVCKEAEEEESIRNLRSGTTAHGVRERGTLVLVVG